VTIKGIQPSETEHITTMRQKINLAVELGIENIFILKFTWEMSQLSYDEFAKRVLGQLNLRALVCGFDFHYGKNGAGNAETLRNQAFYPVEIVEAVMEDGEKISSTRITSLIKEGKIEEASFLLGHPFDLEGKVVEGRHKGTEMGFPTANIRISDEYVIPKNGVYAAWVTIDRKYYGAMVNIGHNPTLNYSEKISVEAHIFNFDGLIYGKTVSVSLLKFMRPEIQFRSRENLIMQMEQDSKIITEYLRTEAIGQL
jgi:riboflavin kinase/FMN adenylyltransferase